MVRVLVAAAIICLLSGVASVRADPPPIEAYGKLPAVEMMRLSPSGDRFAFIAVDGDQRKVFASTIENKPLAAIPIGTAKVRDIEWAGEDHLLITTTATVNMDMEFVVAKQELSSVVVLNLNTNKSFAVFNSPYETNVAHTVAGDYGAFEIGGHWYGFFGGYTYEGGEKGAAELKRDDDMIVPDLYRVDLDSGAMRVVAEGHADLAGWLVSPAGEVVARTIYREKSGNWQVLTSDSGGKMLASGTTPFGGVGVIGFGRAPDSVLIQVPAEGGAKDEEIALAGGAPSQTYNAEQIHQFLFDRQTRLLIGSEEDSDEKASTLFAPALQAKLAGARKAFPGYIVHLISYSTDLNRMIVFTEGGDDSGTYWIVDIAKGSADPLGYAYPDVKTQDVGPVRMVDYKAADGFDLHGILTLPPGRAAKNLPVVILPHGGPAVRDYPSFDWWAQAFASRGYAVFQPNYRGSDGYGVRYREAGFGEWGKKMQTDVSDGLAELARQGIVDPKRACIVGASYGGYAALAGVTVQQGLYRCAVSVAGVANLGGMLDAAADWSDGPNSATRYWKRFMGVTTFWQSELKAISPVDVAAHADAPILLIHGTDDTVVPIEQSRQMAAALRRAGKPVDYMELPGEDHWLSREQTRTAMLKAAVAFVEKNDPADPAPPVATASAGSAATPAP